MSKHIVATARENRQAIVFEDIRDIRGLHSKGNGQGRNYRGKMNSWPYGEIKRQIQYKAQWSGIPIIQLTKDETYGTSILCGICGKRTRTNPNSISTDRQDHRSIFVNAIAIQNMV